jgi:hypothetical protein
MDLDANQYRDKLEKLPFEIFVMLKICRLIDVFVCEISVADDYCVSLFAFILM